MSRRRPALIVLALLGCVACQREVTFHLLKESASAAGSGGVGGSSQAGEGGRSEAGASAAGSAGAAGSPPEAPCQKLGMEVCNGGDDDCNDLVDEGCDYTLVWRREPNGVILGHATGGVMFFEPCPDGSVLTGLRVGMGSWLSQVAAICGQLELNADTANSPVSFTVALGARFDTPFAPAASTDAKNQVQDLTCPAGSLVSGVDGTTTTDTARYILGIRISCAPPIVTTSGNSSVIDVDRTREQTAGPLLCAGCAASQAFNFSTSIDVGHVATGIFGGDGLWVDRVGFNASSASIAPR